MHSLTRDILLYLAILTFYSVNSIERLEFNKQKGNIVLSFSNPSHNSTMTVLLALNHFQCKETTPPPQPPRKHVIVSQTGVNDCDIYLIPHAALPKAWKAHSPKSLHLPKKSVLPRESKTFWHEQLLQQFKLQTGAPPHIRITEYIKLTIFDCPSKEIDNTWMYSL